jgi:hypothetical protein
MVGFLGSSNGAEKGSPADERGGAAKVPGGEGVWMVSWAITLPTVPHH